MGGQCALGVKMPRTQSEQSQSALPRQADLNERCLHFADGPTPDIPRGHRASASQLPRNAQRTKAISLGRHALVKNGSSGLYKRRIVNQPFLGSVWIQLPRLIPA